MPYSEYVSSTRRVDTLNGPAEPTVTPVISMKLPSFDGEPAHDRQKDGSNKTGTTVEVTTSMQMGT